jgi:hypothetical protein
LELKSVLHRPLALVLVSIVLASLFAACMGGESASDRTKKLIELQAQSQYGEAWEMLHPAQRAAVPQEKYVECGLAAEQGRSPAVDKIEIKGSTTEQQDVAEVGTVEARIVRADLWRGEEVFPREYTMVKADGEWTWVMAQEWIDDFKAGRCPGELPQG